MGVCEKKSVNSRPLQQDILCLYFSITLVGAESIEFTYCLSLLRFPSTITSKLRELELDTYFPPQQWGPKENKNKNKSTHSLALLSSSSARSFSCSAISARVITWKVSLSSLSLPYLFSRGQTTCHTRASESIGFSIPKKRTINRLIF